MARRGRGRGEGVDDGAVTATVTAPTPSSSLSSSTSMLAEAETLLREGRAEDALPIALRALEIAQRQEEAAGHDSSSTMTALPILNTIAETYLSLGDVPSARAHFQRAVSLDPLGLIPSTRGGGASKFLQLAQLSEVGGKDSIDWYERGVAVLRREIGSLEGGGSAGVEEAESESEKAESKEEENEEGGEEEEEEGEEGEGGEDIPSTKRTQLASALCGMIEVYMTDLSWDPNAETQCETLISEALLVAPSSPEVLQTLASIRISQLRVQEAREALRGSMAVWGGLGLAGEEGEDEDGDGDGAVPEFATRVSLARLLMEVGMEEEAVGVVERLVREDDGSVEAWYLGGWGLFLLGGKKRGGGGDDNDAPMGDVNGFTEEEDLYKESMLSSREWLRQSLKLYELLDYEDERLRDHARELVGEIEAVVGERGVGEGEGDGGGEEEWNGFGGGSEEEEEEDETMDEG